MLSYIWNQSEFNKNPLCSSSRSFCDVKGWERSRGCPPDSVCCFGPVYSPLSLFPCCKLKPVLNPAQQKVLANERTLSVCASEHVSVCFFLSGGGLQVRGRRSGKRTGLSLLCCFVSSCVACRKSTTKRREPKLFVCPSLLPFPHLLLLLFTHLLMRPRWMGRNGWREPHRQTDHSVDMFVQQRREKKRSQDHLSVAPSSRLPSLLFLLFGRRSLFIPKWWQRCPVCSLKKRNDCLCNCSTALLQLQGLCWWMCRAAETKFCLYFFFALVLYLIVSYIIYKHDSFNHCVNSYLGKNWQNTQF